MLITILSIIVLIFSAIIHEVSHGAMAYKLGDDTAKRAGRLTLNPLAHIDWVGSVALPILFVISRAGFLLAWAKPVPYNPYNLTDKRWGELKVAAAGPLSNMALAIFFGLVARFMPISQNTKFEAAMNFLSGNYADLLIQLGGSFALVIFVMSFIICLINISLAVFNLLPIPPLDGSKILAAFLPRKIRLLYINLEQYGFFILIFLLMFDVLNFLTPAVIYSLSFITGV